MLFGQFKSAGHMTDDDPGTFLIAELVVGINTCYLVFNEIHRCIHLPDIMVKCTNPDQQAVSTNGI